MWIEASDPALAEFQEIARQTSAAIAEHQEAYRLWRRSQVALTDSVQRFVNVAYRIDVARLKEQQFAATDAVLGTVIDGLQHYLTVHVSRADVSHLHLLGEAIRELRDIRGWIVQGLSPDPTKRPSYQEREQMTAESAARALSVIRES